MIVLHICQLDLHLMPSILHLGTFEWLAPAKGPAGPARPSGGATAHGGCPATLTRPRHSPLYNFCVMDHTKV